MGRKRGMAAVFRPGIGMEVEDILVRDPAAGYVRVGVEAAGVCHSDLHLIDGTWSVDRPVALGHEAAGTVLEVGSGVSQLEPGDKVVLSWFSPCRRCRNCAAGRSWLCTGTTALHNTLPDGSTPFRDKAGAEIWPYLGLGAFSQEVVVPEAAAVKVPQELPSTVGALLGCAVTTGVGAVVNAARVRPGDSAVVIGCGGVGLSIVMGLALAGAHPIIAVDITDERLAKAQELGATDLVRGDNVKVSEYLHSDFGGVDFAFEAIGRAESIEELPWMLRAGGKAVLVGMTAPETTAAIHPYDLTDQGKGILGVNYGSSNVHVDIPQLAALYLAGRLPLDLLIGKIRPLSEIAIACDELAKGVGLRTLVTPR